MSVFFYADEKEKDGNAFIDTLKVGTKGDLSKVKDKSGK